jgi:PilZ domain
VGFPQVDVDPKKWHFSGPFIASGSQSKIRSFGSRAIFRWLQVRISEGEMSATNPAKLLTQQTKDALPEGRAEIRQPILLPTALPTLRATPLLRSEQPRRFVRVPTHAVGVHPEHREYPRATLKLPLRLRSVEGVPEDFPVTLVTRDISSTGVFFLCPKKLGAGAPIELEIVLVSRPLGRGNVVIVSLAHVQRVEAAATPGWYGIAASFDDVQFDRDDRLPSRFLKP